MTYYHGVISMVLPAVIRLRRDVAAVESDYPESLIGASKALDCVILGSEDAVQIDLLNKAFSMLEENE